MTKGEGHRVRLLHVLQILWEKSDEQHVLTANQIVELLVARGVTCDRKTIYTDWEELAEFGFDIIRTKQGAYIGSRQFELPELKLLVDAVQASKFITEKKSQELIDKLSQMLSEAERKQLKRQVFVKNRVKTMNESIYYNVDAINEGIQNNRQIAFTYWNWNEYKEMVTRQEGKVYEISPWILMWENEKYYMVGYDEKSKQMKHFRVDKMQHIDVQEEMRQGKELFESIDFATYGIENFSMFQGTHERVTLCAKKELAGVLIDRFGKDIWMHPATEDECIAVVDVVVSNQFYGWITGLGGKITIKEPQWVRDEYVKLLHTLLKDE